jgi:hypothetical protein
MVRHLHFLTDLGRDAGQLFANVRGLFDLPGARPKGGHSQGETSRLGEK